MTENEILRSEGPSARGPAGGPSGSRATAWLAAGVVGVLLAATGGYLLGQSRDQATGVVPPFTLGGAAMQRGMDDYQGSSGQVGEPGAATMRGGMDIMPIGFGHLVFTADGLSDDASASDAWAFDPGAVFSKTSAARVADILGVDGEPTMAYGTWSIGAQDGTGPVLQLSPDGIGSLHYWNPLLDPYACAEPLPGSNPEDLPAVDSETDPSLGASDSAQGGGTEPGYGGTPDGRSCNKPSGAALSDDAAIARLKATMDDLGVDTSGYRFTVADYGTPHAATVTASQVVDGQETGVSWGATFSGEEIQSLYGALAPMISLGSYDVVSPADAVARLGDPRFGAAGWGGPMPYLEKSMQAEMPGSTSGSDSMMGAMEGDTDLAQGDDSAVSGPEPTLPPTMDRGELFSWPVTAITITDARLGLAMHTQVDGSAVLIPTYQLAAEDGSAWSVVAVDDSFLDFSE